VKIAAGADHAGFDLKREIVTRLRAAGHEVDDLGTASSDASVDYPGYAHAVAQAVTSGAADRGLLVCGTGLGMCMAANRHRGVRAADCWSTELAEMSRRHNDANVLCLGGRVLDPESAWAITEVWLSTAYEGGRHERRVAAIDDDPAGSGAAGEHA
jgi:ribose 5-phosphate isomerase B